MTQDGIHIRKSQSLCATQATYPEKGQPVSILVTKMSGGNLNGKHSIYKPGRKYIYFMLILMSQENEYLFPYMCQSPFHFH